VPRPPIDRPDVQVFTEIGVIDQLVMNRLARVLPEGLSHAQFGVLSHFSRQGQATTPAELARAFQVTKGAMTNTVQRLETQGFVAIEPDEADGRRKRLSITPAGQTAHDTALAAMRPLTESLRSAFTEAEFKAALPFLKALRTWLDESR
jgi:DNA-binding MarR family transcriptional regulator